MSRPQIFDTGKRGLRSFTDCHGNLQDPADTVACSKDAGETGILFTDQNRYSSEVNTGALMDITDLLKDNASELYDMIPEDYWKAVEVNGKIYGVPTYKDSSLSEYFVWDQDIADKYNIDVNSVTDFNTLYDALKTVKEGEGGSPYFMSKNGANFLLNLNYDDLSSGLPAIGVKYGDDSKTVVNPLDDEEILSNLDIVRKMYQEGIINGDAQIGRASCRERV